MTSASELAPIHPLATEAVQAMKAVGIDADIVISYGNWLLWVNDRRGGRLLGGVGKSLPAPGESLAGWTFEHVDVDGNTDIIPAGKDGREPTIDDLIAAVNEVLSI